MTERITLVVAGNVSQYQVWKLKNQSINSKYVYNENQLRGYPYDSVRLVFVGEAELNPLHNSQALKVFMDNHNLSEEHNCNNCEYYYRGICNASKTPTTNPLDVNECSDYQLIDRDARSQANQELQAKVTREKRSANDYAQQMEDDYMRVWRSSPILVQDNLGRLRYSVQRLEVSYDNDEPVPIDNVVTAQCRFNNIMNEVDRQYRFIYGDYNIRPKYILINLATYVFMKHEFLRNGGHFSASHCPFKSHYDLDVIQYNQIPRDIVTVVAPINEMLN